VPRPIKRARPCPRADLLPHRRRKPHHRPHRHPHLPVDGGHRAEIIADEAIAARVAPEVWGDAMHALLAEIRQGRVADGMIAAVEGVGAVLAEHLPRADDDANELPDRLIEV
jgi:putative membrane protein